MPNTCENSACVYWEDGSCVLTVISIDAQGFCNDCIQVIISESYLRKRRKELRKKYEKDQF